MDMHCWVKHCTSGGEKRKICNINHCNILIGVRKNESKKNKTDGSAKAEEKEN